MKPRVLIVDDHTVLSQALADALTLHGVTDVMVAVPHQLGSESLIDLAQSWSPNVVLLDLFLGTDQLTVPLVPRLRATGATVVALTASEDRSVWAQALEAGAAGVLPKSVAFDQLVTAVHRAAAGEPLLSQRERAELDALLAESRMAENERLEPFARLTSREQQVLAGLLTGGAAKSIARDLGVSLPTVRTHIRSLFEKLGVNNQRAVVALALREGWQPDAPPPNPI